VEQAGAGLAGRAAERAARQSYGRLLAYLVRAWRDVAAVEDALAEAFTRALVVWPRDGVPDNPDGWLLVAARNKLLDGARSAAVRQTSLKSLKLTTVAAEDPPMIPDKRLELMFVCAHPDIDPSVHTALMLQCVLGLSAERIGSSFLVSPDAMGRRLSRAKARIRDAGTGLRCPTHQPLRVGWVR
jgi:RNA polymerase sigma-70 factor (ECF subfamily)